MIPAILRGVTMPWPEIYLITDPVAWKTSVFVKVKLCCGLSLVGTIWLDDNSRPAMGIQAVTATADMTTTSPAHPWRLL
jgi:hypothetical protein